MSLLLKGIISLAALVIVGFGVAHIARQKSGSDAMATSTTNTTMTTNEYTTVSTNNSSDASIDRDLKNIDVQMNAVSSNGADMDQSFNDKPVSQTE